MMVVVAAPHGDQPLRMQVSPSVMRAPALLTVRISVAARSDDDRFVRVAAESADFYRSSEVEVAGGSGSPLKVFEFRNLPAGLYTVTGVLVGVHGPRATVSQLAKVAPEFGTGR